MSQSSLCIGICQIDDASGCCIGCGRSIDDIYGESDSTTAATPEAVTEVWSPAATPQPLAPDGSAQVGD